MRETIVDRAYAKTLLPPRKEDGHKGDFGKLLVLGGSVGYTGAPYLAASAAVHSGCGLVYLGVPESIWAVEAQKCVSAMPFPLPETDGRLCLAALDKMQDKLKGCDVLALGPGLGRGKETEQLVHALLWQVKEPLVLDADGKLADVMLDELELSVSGGSTGSVTTPEDVRSKRTKGEDYPLAAASSLGKGWAEQADWFADYLTGRTPDEVKKLKTDENGKPQDADLVSGCTIAVDRYRDAVVRACEQAKALGAAQGDRVTLSLIAADLPQDLAATDDQDAHVRADITLAALTVDSDGRVTSAIGDMTQPQLTVSADGTVSGPEEPVYTKNEQGDKYGMREASALHKEWYEHAEGYCSTLKGKTMAEIAAQPTDGSDADLKALCTISVTDLQKAVLAALAET